VRLYRVKENSTMPAASTQGSLEISPIQPIDAGLLFRSAC
jgi:hypothetical protein